MPSTIWNGALTFGLVSVPVKLYSTTRSNETLRFHEYDRGTGGRIRHRRIVEDTGEEVPYDAIVKGVELDDGRVVTVERAELDALPPSGRGSSRSRTSCRSATSTRSCSTGATSSGRPT